ncbi:MAG: glycine cleavage system aminomethyltransferase GcvT [Saprospiraceae bacterium]|nr:glycine cleavage system aminomethyltransferase GcvT [Saprospiraceae bacterium]
MKNTPLTQHHIDLGGKMTDFAGYQMPIQYTSVSEEHRMVREKAGLFDVSHMGEFIIKGKQALDLIQWVTSNDASTLKIGDAQYSCMPNETGGIVDDLLVYRLDEDQCSEGEQAFMLVVNASNIDKDLAWINRHNTFDVSLINISDQTGLLALQGPLATSLLQPLTDLDLPAIDYYSFRKGTVAGFPNVLVSATGYTGAGGFEIYAENAVIVSIWETLLAKYDRSDLAPCGLGARDTLRLEMGYCLYGNDINDKTSPLEAGLGWITKLSKENFISKTILSQQKEEGFVRKLVGFTTEDRRAPRHDYIIENNEEEEIGVVTSGTHSPTLGYPIGMGYVAKPYSKSGTKIYFVAGKKKIEATVSKLPFLKNEL